MYKKFKVVRGRKEEYREGIVDTCNNIIKNVDNILYDFDKSAIKNIQILINVSPDGIAVYNVKKEYITTSEEK